TLDLPRGALELARVASDVAEELVGDDCALDADVAAVVEALQRRPANSDRRNLHHFDRAGLVARPHGEVFALHAVTACTLVERLVFADVAMVQRARRSKPSEE